MKRSCERVQERLPLYSTLPGWRRRLVMRHVNRCVDCAAELERQQTVAEGLRGLGEVAPPPETEPPEELLDEILERVHDPGVRARVAGPARGAVSGARPELSVAAVLVAVLLAYLAWRGARHVATRLRR